MKKNYLITTTIMAFSLSMHVSSADIKNDNAPVKLKALIIDGQNNHKVWPKSTIMIKQYLEETGLFTVDAKRTQYTWRGEEHLKNFPLPGSPATEALAEPKTDPSFSPDFSKYDVVVSNFGWKAAPLPKKTQRSLEKYIDQGGGLVVIHAADNSWPNWPEFNKMIGIGGWGGRNQKSGPYIYYNKEGKLIRDTSEGSGGAHGPQREFQIQLRVSDHPITRGMPPVWMHTKDELYEKLRGPAENMQILASSFSNADANGEGRHEPMLMVLNYGKGRIFHTTLGHEDYSFESVGLIVSIKRGAEWAATGEVSPNKLPADFPSATHSSKRKFIQKK